MPYNVANDPWANTPEGNPEFFGCSGAPIAPSDTVDLANYAKAIVVTASGNLVILPIKNADGATITFTGVSPGFIPPYRVRRVLLTGTTASVASIDR